MSVDTLTSIKVFRQVVESGSFVSAADRLDLSPSIVSKHVMRIEKRLGGLLLNRYCRTLRLTQPGSGISEPRKAPLVDLQVTELQFGPSRMSPPCTPRVAP